MIATMTKLQTWIRRHNPKWLALIRVATGAAILLKGVDYMDYIPKLVADVHTILPAIKSDWVGEAIPWIHIVGGFLILLGLFTRFASIIQIPILVVCVVFVNLHTIVFAKPEQFYLAIALIFLLGIFIIEGSGTLSLSRYFKEAEGEVAEEEEEENEK